MSTHTPGPWRLEINTTEITLRGNDGRGIATALIGVRVGEDRANANLMVAAPEMLKALWIARAIMASAHLVPCGEVEAAIAKAEGSAEK